MAGDLSSHVTFKIFIEMEAAVDALERAQQNANQTMDDIERKIRSTNPDAGPLLDLCNRLRSAKARLLQLKSDVTQLATAQDLLKQNLTQFLVPSSEMIKQACVERNLPAPKIVFSSPKEATIESKPAPVPVEQPNPVKALPKKTQQEPKPKRPTTPKGRKARMPPEPPAIEIIDITDDEFAKLDLRMGHITRQELQEVYVFIANWYKQREDRTEVLTRQELAKSGVKMRAINSILRYLKVLKRIDLTKSGDVKWI